MSGAGETLLKSLYLQDHASDLHAVFTEWQVCPIKAVYNRTWLIWGANLPGVTPMPREGCLIGRQAVTQEWRGRL